jgi:hypothetical protein
VAYIPNHDPAGAHRAQRLTTIQGVLIAGLSAALLFELGTRVPPGIVLPLVGGIALLASALAALAAWARRSPRTGRTVSLWDVAGTCALVGFAALVFCQPDAVLEFLS